MPKSKKRRRAPVPVILQRCVVSVAPEMKAKRRGVGAAFAICTAQLQKSGQLRPGTRKSTPKGAGIASGIARRGQRKQTMRDFERTISRQNGYGPSSGKSLEKKAKALRQASYKEAIMMGLSADEANAYANAQLMRQASYEEAIRLGMSADEADLYARRKIAHLPLGAGRSSGKSLEKQAKALRQASYKEAIMMGLSADQANAYADAQVMRQKSYKEAIRFGMSADEADLYARRKIAQMRDELSRAYDRRRGG